MDCSEFNSMISPHLDGTIQSDQSALLEKHAAYCTSCARTLVLQERISRTMREIGREELQAPPELGGLVLSRLNPVGRGYLTWLPLTWRQTVAAVAALLLLAGGSAGVTAGLKIAGGEKLLAYDPQTSLVDENSAPSSGIDESGLAGEVLPDGIDNSKENQSGNTGVSGNGQGSLSNMPTGAAVSKTTPEGIQSSGTTALLDSGMIVTSTVLNINVEDILEARIKAVALAAGAGASTQVFPEQNGSKKIVVLRLTLASDQAPELITELSGLGTLADRKDESRDITAMYNETLVLCSDLESRRNVASDTGELQQLEMQIASYRQQLDSWAADAGKRVIILWLEN
jgi:hypothetical protein